VVKGIGSALLEWATTDYAQEQGADRLTLEVMRKNEGAVRPYERKGVKITTDPRETAVDRFLGGLFIYCFMGFRYWSVLKMVKSLEKSAVTCDSHSFQR